MRFRKKLWGLIFCFAEKSEISKCVYGFFSIYAHCIFTYNGVEIR